MLTPFMAYLVVSFVAFAAVIIFDQEVADLARTTRRLTMVLTAPAFLLTLGALTFWAYLMSHFSDGWKDDLEDMLDVWEDARTETRRLWSAE